MVLPLTLLEAAKSNAVLVELKSGETFSGRLESHDSHMNMTLSEVIRTNAEGTRFWKVRSVYVRGNGVKYIRFADEVVERARALPKPVPRGGVRGGGRGGARGGGRGGATASGRNAAVQAPRGGRGRGRGGP
ncbi:Sm-like domain protein [Gregarina niphandrodes]|uniref:U6 snRNA-associated Sm-like protein LSm4 n=1 Tax=Gregarina niphandrodes TaxID=110365 RepID=A0A023B4P4_GRENI|nr:Sm-like domain protein [Gregarina niphandrodes]EZG57122.1 Sm-like domain protein [Gregarina niphandrodes]|eukprot:XP_011131105.1 Sm-like domain protein [Gregarina niphandrodes]